MPMAEFLGLHWWAVPLLALGEDLRLRDIRPIFHAYSYTLHLENPLTTVCLFVDEQFPVARVCIVELLICVWWRSYIALFSWDQPSWLEMTVRHLWLLGVWHHIASIRGLLHFRVQRLCLSRRLENFVFFCIGAFSCKIEIWTFMIVSGQRSFFELFCILAYRWL